MLGMWFKVTINNYTIDNTTLPIYDPKTKKFSLHNFVFPQNIPVLDVNELLFETYDLRSPELKASGGMGAKIWTGACS